MVTNDRFLFEFTFHLGPEQQRNIAGAFGLSETPQIDSIAITADEALAVEFARRIFPSEEPGHLIRAALQPRDASISITELTQRTIPAIAGEYSRQQGRTYSPRPWRNIPLPALQALLTTAQESLRASPDDSWNVSLADLQNSSINPEQFIKAVPPNPAP